MSEPLKKSYSQEEAIQFARGWLNMNYPRHTIGDDNYCTRFGLIAELLCEMFPSEALQKKESPNPPHTPDL